MNSRYLSTLLSAAVVCLGVTVTAQAQTSSPTSQKPLSSPRANADTVSLADALARIGQSASVLAVADSTVAQEKVPPADPKAAASTAEPQSVEHQISALVRLLPPGTTFAKIYLPEPSKGKSWQGDDVSAYAYAQARLFGTVGANPPVGFIEIMGQRLPEAQAKEQIAALHLKPVYLVTNPGMHGQGGDALEPWAAMTRNQWTGMSKDQQLEFGRQQAQSIMNMSPEQRAQALKQMKQLDHFLDSVKDPLEKMVGHDL